MRLITSQRVRMSVCPSMNYGRQATIVGDVTFRSEDPGIVRIEAVEGSSVSAYACGVSPGHATVTAAFDLVDRSSGQVNSLVYEADFVVDEAEDLAVILVGGLGPAVVHSRRNDKSSVCDLETNVVDSQRNDEPAGAVVTTQHLRGANDATGISTDNAPPAGVGVKEFTLTRSMDRERAAMSVEDVEMESGLRKIILAVGHHLALEEAIAEDLFIEMARRVIRRKAEERFGSHMSFSSNTSHIKLCNGVPTDWSVDILVSKPHIGWDKTFCFELHLSSSVRTYNLGDLLRRNVNPFLTGS